LNIKLPVGVLADGALAVTLEVNITVFSKRAGFTDEVNETLGTAPGGAPGLTATEMEEVEAPGAKSVLVEGSRAPLNVALTLCRPAEKVKSSAAIP
jgi:hypothetical protein